MSRLRPLRAGRHDTAVAVVFAAFLALVAVDAGSGSAVAGTGPDSSARVTTRGPGLGELLVRTRPSAAATWIEPGSTKARPALHPAVVAAAAPVVVVFVAGLARRRPGPPWHRRLRHSAVLRAPPPLLHT